MKVGDHVYYLLSLPATITSITEDGSYIIEFQMDIKGCKAGETTEATHSELDN